MHHSLTRRLTIATGALLVAALTACSPPPEGPPLARSATSIAEPGGALVIDNEQIADPNMWSRAKSEGTITLYSGYTQDTESEVLKQFEADTGLDVKLIRLTSNRLYERLVAEYSTGKLEADVIRISDPGFVQGLNERGLFQPYQPGTAANLQKEVAFDGGRYFRTFNPVYTFGYNRALIDADEAPTSWNALLDDRWSDKLGIAQAGSGGSALALTRFQRDVLGDDYLREYSGEARVFDSIGAQLDALARGEIEAGTVVVSSVNIANNDNAPVNFVVPDEGVTSYDYYTAVASTAPHLAAAHVFMNWTMSKRGQQVFSDLGEYSVRTDIAPPNILGTQLPEFTDPKVHRISPVESISHAAEDQQVWNSIFGYNE
ncbi:extracellular solute-binding protein [Rhodococcus sp. A14]|uniref:extracellular solute-binding protein n=1 Tax=Rhodococcus sp. A14 TaxID=1194106 RepID=UPI0014247B13|nr:extracellular solute-binding protein [Rhodococcus sp. A14]